MSLAFATFTDAVTGTEIDINPADVNLDALQAVPASQLPTGVANATRIWVRGVVHLVTGTLAATKAALLAAAGGGSGVIYAIFNMATGAAVSRNAAAIAAGLTCTNTGAGVVHVDIATPAAGFPVGSLAINLASAAGSTGVVALNTTGLTATSIPVNGFDYAGLAANVDFAITLTPTPT